jgi:RNase H-like domain found in reverse transcriptase
MLSCASCIRVCRNLPIGTHNFPSLYSMHRMKIELSRAKLPDPRSRTYHFTYAVREWRTYMHGSRFRIRCDHHPLQYLETQPQLSKRQIRWVDALAEFDHRIEYYKGKWNVLSDALSRPPDLSTMELFTGEENERQATAENIRFNS